MVPSKRRGGCDVGGRGAAKRNTRRERYGPPSLASDGRVGGTRKDPRGDAERRERDGR